jgi:hypothetical protein
MSKGTKLGFLLLAAPAAVGIWFVVMAVTFAQPNATTVWPGKKPKTPALPEPSPSSPPSTVGALWSHVPR